MGVQSIARFMLVNCLGVDLAKDVQRAHGTTCTVDPDPAACCCHKKTPTTTMTNNTGIPMLKRRRVREFIIISFLFVTLQVRFLLDSSLPAAVRKGFFVSIGPGSRRLPVQ